MPSVKIIVAQLHQLADELEQHENPNMLIHDNQGVYPIELGEDGKLTIVLHLDGTRLKLRTQASPLAIRERATNLTRQARVLGSGYSSANKQCINRRKLPPISRPKYSEKLFQQFITDGEKDNAMNYYREYHPAQEAQV